MNLSEIPKSLRNQFEAVKNCRISLDDLFIVPETPLKWKLIRKYAAPAAGLMPTKIRYFLTNIVKILRNPSKKLSLTYPLDFDECCNTAEKLNGIDLAPWWGKKCVICISHDVDNIIGYNYVRQMAEIDRENGLKTTFNFLTNDNYKVDEELLRFLKENNFEIGLHGYDHDQGFAFRNPEKMNQKFDRALNCLSSFNIKGYRSPALSLSENLFYLIGRNNLYDSSLQVGSPFYYSVKFPYPYYIEKYKIWEIPLTVQDDNYFRDAVVNEKDIFDSITRFIEEITALNGVFVMNLHPHLMAVNEEFYIRFLKFINNFDAAFKTTGEVIDYVKGDSDNG